MPHFLGDILVVTKEELIPACFSTENVLQSKLYRYKDKPYGIKRAMLGGNGRQLLVKFDSLDKKHQQTIGDPRLNMHPLEDRYKTDSNAVTFYTEFQYPDGSYLLSDACEKYIVNASVLTALIRLEGDREAQRIAKGGTLRGIINTLYSDAHKFNAVLAKKYDEQHTLNSSLRRFKQQYKDFKNDGYASLIKDVKGRSKQNARKIDTDLQELLNNLFAGQKHKPTATEVSKVYEAFLSGNIDVINETTGQEYNPADYKILSHSAITNYLRTYESKAGTYSKRSGDRQKFMQEFVPYESMEQPTFAGSMISIDDRQPPFKYDKNSRMWWYLAIDLASECVTAWAYGKTKEELILNFYRQMVRNYHEWNVYLPDALECESSLNSSFKNTFLKDGAMFQNVQIHPNSARSKRIERYFKNFRYGIEKKQEGWIARPFAKSESNQISNEKTQIVPYNRLVEQCFENIITWNNSPNEQDESISRFDYFTSRQNPDLKPTNYKSFLKHLGYKTATSCHAGIIKLQKTEWLLGDKGSIYTGEDLIRLLKLVEGKDFDVYWLDGNDGKPLKSLIYTKDGRYICEALPKPKAARAPIEATADHLDAREILSRYRNTVTAFIQKQKNKIDKISLIDNREQTVSSSFSIGGFKTYKPSAEPAQDLGEADQEEEIFYNPNSQDTARSWRENFR